MASVKGEKIWADAIRKAVHCYMDVEGEDGSIKKMRVLNQLAVTVCRSAAKGDIAAIKEVGDRLDGKPQVSVDMNVETINYVARMPEQVTTPEEWQEQHAPKTIQ